jgi:hypothetical protein
MTIFEDSFLNEMTELEKCMAGRTYRFDDPEMVARKTEAIRNCEAFNALDGTDYEAQYRQLQKMLGAVGERVWIAKTFNCDDRPAYTHHDGQPSTACRGAAGVPCLGEAGPDRQ